MEATSNRFGPNSTSGWNAVNSANWSTINKIAFVGYGSLTAGGDIYIDGLEIIGNVIRGAYDGTSIEQYGCRFLTIKDSIASTDTLNANDTNSSLSQLAIYELLRNRVVRTTGQISIPLTPTIKGGQLIHIHACYDPNYINETIHTEQIVNGGFETGSFTPWTYDADCSINPTLQHSGNYCAQIGTFASISTYTSQTLNSSILVSDIDNFTIWLKTVPPQESTTVKVTLTYDEESENFTVDISDSWQSFDILSHMSYLTYHFKKIEIRMYITNIPFLIDDVSLYKSTIVPHYKYRIDKDFRITEAKHTFTREGAITTLSLIDDLYNSIPINTVDPYSIVMRAINPDYQTRTYGSLKISGGDFDANMKPITKDYFSP